MSESTFKVPDGFFSLEDISTFRALDGEKLADVNYYFWAGGEKSEQRFLLFTEILFVSEQALILTPGEDSDAIRIAEAMDVINKAKELMVRNEGKPAVQQMNATNSAVWQPHTGQKLVAVRLTRNEEGLYLNDALLLEFESGSVIIALHDKGGLAVTPA